MSKKYQAGPKRPIDKEIMLVGSSSLGTTQDNTTLRTSTVAETYTGGHIQISAVKVSGGGFVAFVLAMIPENLTIPTISTTDGSALFVPEEFVLWSGVAYITSTSAETIILKDKIKTMRKMKNGDRLVLCQRGSAATVTTTMSVVTSFFKQ